MSNKTQVLAAIERTEKALSFIQREIEDHIPNEFGKYPYHHSKEAIAIATKIQKKYTIIYDRLNTLLFPVKTNVPASWYAHH